MVNHIELLGKDTIDKIAAGEVVEKPASVVKELVENSIDAGATAITVEILKGGLESIRITDNGAGIPYDEISLAFLRHSTSKIRSIEDLTCIKSLGFRGEALSSIAAVSKVEVITKTKDETLGSHYIIEGANELDKSNIGAPDGTTFFVRSLFYNTPARKKFLKSATAEGSAVYDVVEHLALCNPSISFQFLQDHKVKFTTVGNCSLSDCIYQLYGKEIAKAILSVSYEDHLVTISGFVGDSTVARGNRSLENFFVNGRYVKSKVLSAALENAFVGQVMQHQYPFSCLFIDFKGDGVDVNVHPTKMEVRFFDNEYISDVLYNAVYNVLHKREDIRPVIFDENIPKVNENNEVDFNHIKAEPFENNSRQDLTSLLVNSMLEDDEYVASVEQPIIQEELQENLQDEIKKEISYEQTTFLSEKAIKQHRIIGQVFDTYWLVEFDGKLFIIDQHAAHEKVLFERTMRSIKDKTMTSQTISPPIIISLSAAEEEVLNLYKDQFSQIGYCVDSFGGREFAITAVPSNVFGLDNKQLFYDLLNNCIELKGTKSDLVLEKVASMSCKAAVKGHDHLSFKEAESLISQLLECENPYHCPHGRPTIISMSQYELEKKFKRIV